MKKLYQFIIILTVTVLPVMVLAEVKEYVPVSEATKRIVDKIEISSIHFVDNTDGPANNFGLVADLSSTTKDSSTIKAKIGYYDKDKVLLYSFIKEVTVHYGQKSTLVALLDARMNNKYSPKEIAFYSIDFVDQDTDYLPSEVSSSNETCSDGVYTIDHYELLVDVNIDSTYDVQERFTVTYNTEKKTFKRKIPLKREIVNRDESTDVTHTKVLSFQKKEGLFKVFQVGSGAVFTFDDEDSRDVSFSHTLNYSVEKINRSKSDVFDFAITSDDLGGCVNDIKFEIKYPSEFDISKISFVTTDGKDKSSSVDVDKSGTIIMGTYTGTLSDDSLHVRLFLGEDYFEKRGLSLYAILIFVIPGGVLGISFVLWFFFGRDKRIASEKENVSVKNVNILELSIIKNGEVKKGDVVLLLLCLANDGYIKFERTGRNKITKTNEYDIIKLKEYAGKNVEEKKLFAELFSKSISKINDEMLEANYEKGRGSKKLKDLRSVRINTKELGVDFVKAIEEQAKASTTRYYEKIYEKSSLILKKFITSFDYLILFSVFILATLEYGTIEDALIIVALLVFCLTMIREGLIRQNEVAPRIASLIAILLSVLLSRITPLWETLFYSRIFVYGLISGLLAILINQLFKSIMPKKTEYGTRLTGKMLAIEKFLNSLDKESIVQLQKDNPNFVSEYLPYILLFNSDKFLFKLMETSRTNIPEWLVGCSYKDLKMLKRDLEFLVSVKENNK